MTVPHVLYVEDNASNVLVVQRVCEHLNLSLRVVGNASDAVASVLEAPPCLILMDVSLPDVDGLAATRLIRSLPQPLASLPIIAITASAMIGDRERCLAAGCNDYLAKPFSVRILIDILKSYLKQEG
ncbi:MAG: response regulator [Aggregatilineales bacterium]